MRAQKECYPCLEGLARRTASLATPDRVKREEAFHKGLTYLTQNLSCDQIPTRIAGEMQRVIRAATENRDPFMTVKEKEMQIARELAEEIRPALGDDLPSLITFAAKGNSIDFFLDLARTREEIQKPVSFAINDIEDLRTLLEGFKKSREHKAILYFADNAGECYFDLPLVKKLADFAEVIYVVKENPVQNDLTLEDLERSGIREKFKRVITTGSDTPGLDLSLVSKEFFETLVCADLLLAKGMGYYETLPELGVPAPAFFLLKAKCAPIARSLNVPLNSYVARLMRVVV
ncbi:MAG: ARMT1-like domain-containing protein [Bacillota bacterium]